MWDGNEGLLRATEHVRNDVCLAPCLGNSRTFSCLHSSASVCCMPLMGYGYLLSVFVSSGCGTTLCCHVHCTIDMHHFD